jgi:hypothetical protein
VEINPEQPDRLRNLWYAVVNDMALYLGDVIIDRAPTLRWTFFDKATRDLAYQRHVLMGFSKAANPLYNVDIDMRLASYGLRVAGGGKGNPQQFRDWVEKSVALA